MQATPLSEDETTPQPKSLHDGNSRFPQRRIAEALDRLSSWTLPSPLEFSPPRTATYDSAERIRDLPGIGDDERLRALLASNTVPTGARSKWRTIASLSL